MRKTITILLATVLLFPLFVSCNNGSVDDAFNCTVTFDGNGATSGEMPAQTVGIGVDTRLNANTFEKTDFRFAGWNTKADGSGTAYADGQSISVTENTILYAQWSLYRAAIVFNSNGGVGTMENQKVIVNTTTALSPNSFTLYVDNAFAGWNTEKEGSGTAYSDGQEISIDDDITLYAQWNIVPIILDSKMQSWTDGNVYTLNSSITISSVVVSGSAILILKDGCTLTVSDNIEVDEGNSLTITASGEGTGILEVAGSGGHAGIGGWYGCNSGTIIINGGTVNASTQSGAGIGGGYMGSGGTITINGGTVNASSEDGGASIGGGPEGSGGTIIINGGTVNASAKGTGGGAGIGGGYGGSGGTITINNGTVNASTEADGAGIGGGYYGTGGTITINGGTVKAISGSTGAGIGGGHEGSGGTITIYGGIVSATSDVGAGIGRGYNGANDGTLTLGKVVALEVSSDNENWSDYDGTTRQKYMRTK